jgi:hypothetical protein
MVAVLGQNGLRPERKSDHSVLRETNGMSTHRRTGALSAIVKMLLCASTRRGREGTVFICCGRLTPAIRCSSFGIEMVAPKIGRHATSAALTRIPT